MLSFVRQHGQVKRAEVMALCRLSEGQVKDLLRRMRQAGLITLVGAGPAARYLLPTNESGGDRMEIGRNRMKSDGEE